MLLQSELTTSQHKLCQSSQQLSQSMSESAGTLHQTTTDHLSSHTVSEFLALTELLSLKAQHAMAQIQILFQVQHQAVSSQSQS